MIRTTRFLLLKSQEILAPKSIIWIEIHNMAHGNGWTTYNNSLMLCKKVSSYVVPGYICSDSFHAWIMGWPSVNAVKHRLLPMKTAGGRLTLPLHRLQTTYHAASGLVKWLNFNNAHLCYTILVYCRAMEAWPFLLTTVASKEICRNQLILSHPIYLAPWQGSVVL